MAPPPEENRNPYQEQTEHNTDTAWLHDGGYKQLKADLDGMADYATNMQIIRDNLFGNIGYLNLLNTLPGQAWEPGALPEGVYTAKLLRANYTELQQYLSYLWQALNNIGSAAQTIAQAYAGTDGWSAADLNSVKFAYGDRDAQPPSSYPRALLEHVRTWREMYSENMRTGNAAASGVIVTWTEQEPYTDATGTHYVATSSDGVTRQITEFYSPSSGLYVTTTITYPPSEQYPNGRVITTQTRSTSSLAGGHTVETTTYNYGPDGQLTGHEVESTTYQDGEVVSHGTANYNTTDDQPTSSTTTATNPDTGTETITTTTGDQTRVVQIGEQTEGASTTDSPYQDAVNEARPG